MTEPIKLQVDATVSELMSANNAASKVIFAGWRRLILIIASIGWALVVLFIASVIFFALMRVVQNGYEQWERIVGAWPFLVLLATIPVIIARSRMLYGFAARSRFGIRRDYTIDQSEVEVITPGGVLRIHWHGIEAVRETRKLIVLVYANMFMVLPKRCFPSAETATEAADQMRRWHAEALS